MSAETKRSELPNRSASASSPNHNLPHSASNPSSSVFSSSSSSSSSMVFKPPPDGLVIPPPKPKLSKAERRALQESQRAAKGLLSTSTGGERRTHASGYTAAGTETRKTLNLPPHAGMGMGSVQESKHTSSSANASHMQSPPISSSSTSAFPSPPLPKSAASTTISIPIIAHLPPPVAEDTLQRLFSVSGSRITAPAFPYLHPRVVQLGYEYATGRIRGGNARCRAMLECFALVIANYQPQAQQAQQTQTQTQQLPLTAAQAMDQHILKPSFAFWIKCRPHSVSMGNAVTFLKAAVASASRDIPLEKLKEQLVDTIRAYQHERIDLAGQAIAELLLHHHKTTTSTTISTPQNSHRIRTQLLSEKDVVLVFGHSEVISLALQQSATSTSASSSSGYAFSVQRVIVVDARPLREGRHTLKILRAAGIECTYVELTALSYVISDVTKVLLGASALMSDGSVLGRAGMASVALVAHQLHIPVLVCAETYKISHRVQLESMTINELAPFSSPISTSDPLSVSANSSQTLQLLYDLTPAQFISCIVTELGIVPPTSVAVLLREMNPMDMVIHTKV